MNVIKNLRCKTSSLAHYSQYLIVLCLCFYYFYLSRKIGLSTENGGPDEIARSLLPRCIVNGNPYPSANDSCSVYHLGNYSYAVYPQLLTAYVSAFFMTIAKAFGATEPQIFLAGRLASVFFAGISLIAISKTISFLFSKKAGRQTITCLSVILLGCWPQFAFLASYMNNDIAGLAGVALLILSLVRGISDKWGPANVGFLCTGIIISGLGYWNAAPFILTAIPVFILTILKQRSDQKSTAIKTIAIAFLICATFIMPFIIGNAVRYGDVTGTRTFNERYQQWLASGGQELMHPYGPHLRKLLADDGFVNSSVESFIAYFGYMFCKMPSIIYLIYLALAFIGIGLYLSTEKYRIKDFRYRAVAIPVAIACIIVIILFLYRTMATDYQPQGRYFIFILIPLIICCTIGIGNAVSIDSTSGKLVVIFIALAAMTLCLYCFNHAMLSTHWTGIDITAWKIYPWPQ